MRLLSLVFINHHPWFLVNIFIWRCPPLLDQSVSLTAQIFRAVCLHACSITGSLWDGWLESYPAESGSLHSRGRIFKLWRSPEIDSKELIPPAYVAWAGIFKKSMGARNRGGIGLPYRTGPPGYIGWRNSFLGINSGAPYTFKSKGSGRAVSITLFLFGS